MEGHRIRRVFEQIKPTPAQEEAMLERLLNEGNAEQSIPNHRKAKKIAVVLAAAALLLMTCAFAVVSGLDQKLMDYLGAESGEEKLLSGAWTQIDQSHTYANGWTVEIRQMLADRYSVTVLADVVAPEGETLNAKEVLALEMDLELYDARGTKRTIRGAGFDYEVLEDKDQGDGRVSVLWMFRMADAGVEQFTDGSVELMPVDLVRSGKERIKFWEEEWSCQVPLPQASTGRAVLLQQDLHLQSGSVPLTEVYLSPMHLAVLFQEPSEALRQSGQTLFDMDHTSEVSVTLADGRTVSMRQEGMTMSIDDWEEDPEKSVGLLLFWPEEFLNPEEAVSVTILGQTFPLEK